MKIIQFIVLLGCASLIASCSKNAESDLNYGVEIAPLESLSQYNVPVKKGYTTVVSYQGEVLATTRNAIKISIPAAAKANKEALKVEYSQDDIFGDYGSSQYWQYISFEDTRNGDYDYNDVVIHCRVATEVPWNYDGKEYCSHRVSVQPVALGGVLKLKLGILYRDDDGKVCEQILCEDIRRDLFAGNPIFPINTDPKKEIKKVTNYLTKLFEVSTREADFKVVWFIESATDRLYAATTNFGLDKNTNMISKDGYPYGMSLTSKWNYPIEKTHIRTAYPDFDRWMKDGDEVAMLKSMKKAYVFPATIVMGPEGDLWDWFKK